MLNPSECKLVEYKAWHGLAILKSSLRGEKESFTSDKEAMERASFFERSGPAYTYMKGDAPVGCAGVVILRKGLGEAWSLVSKDSGVNPLTIHRMVKKTLMDIIEQHGLNRVQANTILSDQVGARWLELLGFKNETPFGMQKFGPNGGTYYLYSMVRK